MDMNEERKKLNAERKRIRHYEKYHSDPDKRKYHIEYEQRRREDPEYRARRNVLQLAAYHRKKELAKQQQVTTENIRMDVN